MADADRQKLKNSLISNQFIQPFYVWLDPTGVFYCLDGKHRYDVLRELAAEGATVPDLLPAISIYCKDKQEASKLVLIFSSAYAKITQQGIQDFASIYELNLPEIMHEISLPDIKIEDLMPLPSDLDGEPKEKPATMKITFDSYVQLEKAIPVIEQLLKTNYSGAFFSVSYGEI